MKVMQCTQCGAKIHMAEDGSFVCDYCGSVMAAPEQQVAATATTPQPSAPQPPVSSAPQPSRFDPSVTYTATGERYTHKKKKAKWLAIVLCITLGIFGAHRFYEGKYLSGLVYLFTYGLCFIGVIIDFFILLSRPEYY